MRNRSSSASIRNVLRGLIFASVVLVLLTSQGPLAEGVTHITRTAVIANDSSGISAMATQGGQKLFEDAFGKTIAVYIDGTGRIGITYANSNPTITSSWATPVKKADLFGYSRPAAVLVSSSSLRIIAEGGSGLGHVSDIPVTITRDSQNNIASLTFGTRVSLDTSGKANYPSAVLAHNGNILAIWWQNATISSIVKSFRWISGTGWRGFGGSSMVPDDAIVDTSDLDIIFPSLIQRDDNRHVYMFGNRAESSPNRNLVFNKATFGGANWSWGTQNLAYETGVARGPFDVPSAVWDPIRQLVVVAHDISGFQKYSVFTLTSSDVKTHLDTPDLAINNNEWGNIEVYEPTGEYYIFMIDSVNQVVNHDNGRIGYIRYNGAAWESSLTIIDSDTNNVGISMRKTGSNSTMDFLYTDTSGGSPNQLKFVSVLQVENATTIVFPATEDASVFADQPNTNFGSAQILEVDSGPVAKHTFLRFQLSGLPSHQLIEARLRIFGASTSGASSNRGGDFYTTSNSWNESTITWNNAPAANTGIIASLGAVSASTWNEVDITSTITGTGPLNIKIVPASSDGADYSSSEGTNPPELVVIFSNTAPVLASIGNKSVGEETPLSFTATATDADNDSLTFSLAPGAPLGASVATGGIFSWTPTESQGPGNYQATIVVSDGALSDNETITITVNEVNRAPTITVQGAQLVQEGSPLSFTVTATDFDIPANSIVFSASGMPSGATLNPTTGAFSWTPTQAQGPGDYTISFTATDNGTLALSDTKSVAIHVNEPPVIPAIPDQSIGEETLFSLMVNATDADLPPQTLTYTLLPGAPAGASIDPSSGVFSWTPSETQGPGTYSVTVSVNDGFGGTSTRVFSITVAEVNTQPSISVLGPQTLDEGGSVSFSINATDADIPQDTLTLSASGLPSGATFDPLTGLFSWTTSEVDGPGSYTITFTATDNGSPQLSESKTVNITVNEVNQQPELNPIGAKTTNEETQLSFTATATDLDLPTNALTFSLGPDAPPGASITPEGTFSWTPTEIQGPGSYNITIIVSDGSLTDSETITVTVNEENKPPVLSPIGSLNVDEQSTLAFNATATDDDAPVQSLTFSLTSSTNGTFPTGAVITPQGGFSWTPDESQGPGSYSARIVVFDGVTSSFEDITTTVSEVTGPPVLAPVGSKTVDEETVLSFTTTATDPDLPANTLVFSLGPGAPAGAGIDPVSGVFTWTPTEAQGPGTYTVRVIVSDGQAEDFEDILVTVNEVNRPPIIDPIPGLSVDEETLVSIKVNGSDPDIPSQTLNYLLSSGPNGSAIDPVTGIFSWSPSEAQGPGTYTVTVSVVDESGASVEQTFTITVLEVNTPPTLSVPGPQTVEEGTSLSFNVTAADQDLPANNVTLSVSGLPPGASFNATTGLLTWNPSEAQGPGNYTIVFTAVDDGIPSLSYTKSVTVTVLERPEPPVLNPTGPKTVDEENLLAFVAAATDPDIPADTQTFSLGPGAPAGASIDPATGAFSWTPTESQGPGTYLVRIVVSDGVFTDFEDVSISIAEVNTVPDVGPLPDVTISEGSLVTFTVQFSDSDVPANSVTISSSQLPPGASFDSATGVFSWTPSEQQGPGQFTVSFTAMDDGTPPLSSTTNVTITVLEVNLAPEIGSIGGKTVDEETLLTFNATATDNDTPTQELTFSLSNAPQGAAIDPITGVFTWTPTEAQGPGTYTFEVRVTDSFLGFDSENVTITVNEVNLPPVLQTIGPQSVDEETLLSFTAIATDPDIPANTLTFSLIGAPQEAAIDPSSGFFEWTPSEAQGDAIYSIEIRVTDNSGLFDSETIAITAREVNKPPVLNVPGDQSVDEGTTLTFNIAATDSDIPAQTLTLSSVSLPAGAIFNASTGQFSWTPDEAQGPGTYTATFEVSDGSLVESKNVTIFVAEVNQPPSVDTIPDQLVDELSTFTVAPVASDSDLPAQTLTFGVSGNATGLSIDIATGAVNWTPQEEQGPGVFVVTVTVLDSFGASASQTFAITVNEVNSPPVLNVLGPQTVNEDELLTFTLTSTDPDVPANTVSYSATGLPSGAGFDNVTGVFSWTPSADQGPGHYIISFTATDNGNLPLSDTKTVVVHVNEPPTLFAVGNRTVDEESTLSFNASAADADQPPQTLAFSLGAGAPQGASITPEGLFSWTPDEEQGPGLYQVTINVSDGLTSDSETISITVEEVNVAPVLNPVGTLTVNEETNLTFIASASDQDLPVQTLSLSLEQTPAGTFPTGATITPAGTFAWIPTESQGPGAYSVRIVVSDGVLSDWEDITINVDEVNRAPTLGVPGSQTVDENTLLTFVVTVDDPDSPANTLTVTPSGMPAGAVFTLGTRTFSWTPSDEQGPGDHFVTFTVSDDGTPSLSDSKTVHIHVNEPPVLGTIGAKIVDEETILTFRATAADSDQPPQSLSFSMTNAPDGASIDSVTGVFNWTPSEVQGPAVYTVRVNVNDGFATDFEDVTITVNEVNRTPVISPIGNKTVNENENLTFTVTASDPDLPSNTVTLSVSGLPQKSASFDPSTGQFSWTPSEVHGPSQYVITFTAVDDGLPSLSGSETITVEVLEMNTPPVLGPIGDRVVGEETSLVFTANATDTDLPANTLTFALGPGAPSSAVITNNGEFSWTPSEQQGPNVYQIVILVSDGFETDSETITVTVLEVNMQPVLAPIASQSIDEGVNLTLQLSATDPDDPSNNLSYSATGHPAGSTFDPVTGTFSWTPSENQGPGNYTINFTVSDDGAPSLSDTKTVTITANEVNVAPTFYPISPKTVDETFLLRFLAFANDPDIPANTLSYSLEVGSPTGATVNPVTALFEWTPTEQQSPGTYAVTILVSDRTTQTSITVSIAVNEVNTAPTLDQISNPTIPEETALEFPTTAADPDVPVQTLTFSITDAPNGTFPLGASITQSGLFTWTPNESQGPGTYQVRFVVSDGVLTDYQDVAITVEEVNKPPSLTLPGNPTTGEGSLLNFTITGTDPDLPVNSITITHSGLPVGASFDRATGVFTWTPSENQGPGVYVVSFTATDDGSPQLSTTGSVTITVNELNEAPVLAAVGDKTVDEETTLSFNATAFDTDVLVQLLSFSLNSAPAGASLRSDGVFLWTPTEEQGQGSYQFTIIVSDGFLTDNETITVTVNEVNRPPALILVKSHGTPEEQLLTFTVVGTDPDVPANTLTLSASNIPEGASFDPLTGVFSWVPSESQGPGTYLVTFTVSDNGVPVLSTTETVTITVSEVNTPPQISPISGQTVDEENLLTFNVTATDSDLPPNSLAFSLDINAPAGANIDPATGTFTWTPTEVQGPGTFEITVIVSDGVSSPSVSFSVTVNEVNNAPTLEPIGNKTIPEETLLQFTANASDVDLPAQQTSFSLTPAPNGTFPVGASISPEGDFAWTPSEAQGPGAYTVRVSVSDGIVSVFEDITIQVLEVNTAPSVSVPASQTINEGTTLTFTILATDPDIPANTVTLSVLGLPEGATFDPVTGTFNWTPSNTQGPGDYTINFTATDDGNPVLSDAKTVTIHVNEAPVLEVIADQTADEETLVTFTAVATDADQPAQTLVFSLSNAPPAGTFDAATGVFTWTPTEEQGPGLYQVTVSVSDGFATDFQDVSIEILEVNRPPGINLPSAITVVEETLLSFLVDTSDPDVPLNNVSVSVSGLPPGASFDQVTRTFSWTPSEAQGPGSYTVTFAATDNGTPALSANATLVISVVEANQQPVLLPIGDQSVDEETFLTFTASATDSDVPANDLVFSLGQGSPSGASITPQGVFTWTPAENQGFATYLITIIVSDGFLNDNETITVTVNEVNRTPSLVINDTYAVGEASPFTLVLAATDQDVPSNSLTFSASNLPNGAVFDPLTGTLTWTPDELQGPGSYTINFTVTDDGSPALSETRSVTISVNEVNQAPMLDAIGGRTVDEETLLTFVAVASDPDYPTNNLVYSLGNAPAGSIIDPASGVFSWTPTEAQGPGIYLVQVVVTDGLLTDSETVEISVNEVDSAPQLQTVADQAVSEETLLSFTVSASDSDIPSNQLTFTLGSSAPAGMSITQSGDVSWMPTEQQGPGVFDLTIIVSDGTAADNQTITITVLEVNTAPVLNVPGKQTADEETTIILSISATDLDSPANSLAFSVTGLPTGASFDPLTGIFSWRPSEAQGPGTYSITFTVTDDGVPALEAASTLSITILEVNQHPELAVIGSRTVDEETPLNFTASATDTDAPQNSVTFSLGTGAPQGAAIDAVTGVFTWTPSELQGPGPYSIRVIVDDGQAADFEDVGVTVLEVNKAPEVVVPATQLINEGSNLSFVVTALESDLPANSVALSASGLPEGALFDPVSGIFSWTPSSDQGPGDFTVTFTAVDDGSPQMTDSKTVLIHVNEAPVLSAIGSLTADEEWLLSFTANATDADLPMQPLTFSLMAGSPAGASISPTGLFTWTPTEQQGPGNYPITVIVSDGFATDSETITITVGEVNKAPSVATSGPMTVAVGTTQHLTVRGTDSDVPANVVGLSASGLVSGMSFNTSTGVFLFTPDPSQTGLSFTVTFTATDDGSPSLNATQSVTIQVVSWLLDDAFLFDWADYNNDGTVSIIDVSFTAICFEAATGVGSSGCGPVLSVYWDFDRDGKTTIVDVATVAFLYGSSVSSPYPGQGLATGQMDSLWDNNCAVLNSAYQSYCLATLANTAPQLEPIGNRTVDEGSLLTFNVAGTDADGDGLTFYLGPGSPEGVSMTSSGIFTWTPTEAQGPGNYQVTIIVSDGSLVDFETITIVVSEVL